MPGTGKWHRVVSNIFHSDILSIIIVDIDGSVSYIIKLQTSVLCSQAHKLVEDGHGWSEYISTSNKQFAASFAFLQRCERGHICENPLCSFLSLSEGHPNTTCFEGKKRETKCSKCKEFVKSVTCNALKATVFNNPKDAITEIKYVS